MSDLVLGRIHAATLVVEGVLSVYARVAGSGEENDADDERSTTDGDR